MRRIVFLATLFGALALNAATPDTLIVLQKNSSWINSLPGGGRMECTISASCPQSGNEAFNASFVEWLNSGLNSLFQVEVKGSADALLSNFEQKYFLTRENEIASMMKGKSVQRPFNIVLDAEIKKVYEKNSIITFRQTLVHYPADGSRHEVKCEKTFNKSTGTSYTWKDVVATKKQQQFNKVLVQAVGGYFGVRDLENLKSLMVNGTGVTYSNFPLPKEGPAFESTGIRIIYAAGELASAQLGSPSVVIPYSSVSSFLTPTAKKLIK